jgi:hypothetical protein
MKLGLRVGAMVATFALGAATVHCGTTDFASGGDAGSDGGGGTGKKDGSGSGSSGHDSGAAKDSGAGHDSGGSPDTGAPACKLSNECTTKGTDCCYSVTDKTATCAASPCANGTFKTCQAPVDCTGNTGGVYCCVSAIAPTKGGLCERAAECVGVPGDEILCDKFHPCPTGAMCSAAGVCVAATDGGMVSDGGGGKDSGGKDGGSGSSDACTPGTCAALYPNECGHSLSAGCGQLIDCDTCTTGETCSASLPGEVGSCSTTCATGSLCGGTCCTAGETCKDSECEVCIACVPTSGGGATFECCAPAGTTPGCGATEGTCTGFAQPH